MRAALIATILAASSLSALSARADTQPRPASQTSEAAALPQVRLAEAPSVAAQESPLIAYANELKQDDSGHIGPSRAELGANHIANANLRAVTFEMSRHPPPRDEDCAHTLGASRFAEQYAELAAIQDQLGNYQAVIDASKSALACAPRDASHEALIASAQMNLGHIAEARAAAERGNALNPEDRAVREVRARVDFIQERWADATARFRLQALDKTYTQFADYARCFLWLAQRRAGVRAPELPPVPVDARDASSKYWPAQILDTLRGQLSEADLVEAIRNGAVEVVSRNDLEDAPRGRLTEALFYVGELRLAEGDVETARRYFATVVNLRVLNFVEYGMARAELAKMREQQH